MIFTQIIDKLNNNKLKVFAEGFIGIARHAHPVPFEESSSLPFRQFVSSDGVGGGTLDMAVNGSVTPQVFYIGSNPDYDVYIKSIQFEISDTGALALNKFGALSALANGVAIELVSLDSDNIVLHEGVQTSLDLIKMCMGQPAYGNSTDAFLADVSGGGAAKSYLPFYNISELYGYEWGFRLRKNSNDKLMITINDDLSSLTKFDAIAYGVLSRDVPKK